MLNGYSTGTLRRMELCAASSMRHSAACAMHRAAGRQVIETYLALAGSFVLCTRHHVLDDAALQWNDRQVPRAHAPAA